MIEHPIWCSPALCDVASDPDLPADGGFHRSTPMPLDLALLISPLGPVRAAAVWLQQAVCPWPTTVFLHFQVGEHDGFLPLADATAVLDRLADLIATEPAH